MAENHPVSKSITDQEKRDALHFLDHRLIEGDRAVRIGNRPVMRRALDIVYDSLVCTYCNKVFRSRYLLAAHKRYYNGPGCISQYVQQVQVQGNQEESGSSDQPKDTTSEDGAGTDSSIVSSPASEEPPVSQRNPLSVMIRDILDFLNTTSEEESSSADEEESSSAEDQGVDEEEAEMEEAEEDQEDEEEVQEEVDEDDMEVFSEEGEVFSSEDSMEFSEEEEEEGEIHSAEDDEGDEGDDEEGEEEEDYSDDSEADPNHEE